MNNEINKTHLVQKIKIIIQKIKIIINIKHELKKEPDSVNHLIKKANNLIDKKKIVIYLLEIIKNNDLSQEKLLNFNNILDNILSEFNDYDPKIEKTLIIYTASSEYPIIEDNLNFKTKKYIHEIIKSAHLKYINECNNINKLKQIKLETNTLDDFINSKINEITPKLNIILNDLKYYKNLLNKN